jgi:hypothetical protein
MKEEFILPDKWCIKGCVDFNRWINNWDTINEDTINVSGRDEQLFFYNSNIKNPKLWQFTDYIPKGYTEISFEQFKQYVLKEEPIIEPLKDYTYLIKILEKL